jgi:Flp pilus assembly protein TadD
MLYLHLLRETVGKHCVNPGCDLRLKRVDEDTSTCKKCGQRLEPKNRINWRLAGPLLASLLLLVALTGYLTKGILERRAAAREQELLAQATARFQGELRGVTLSEVDKVADTVQVELRLTGEQRKKIIQASQESIDLLPRELTPEAKQRLESKLRELYKDGRISTEERRDLDRFAREERLAPATVSNVEESLKSRLEAVQQSISRGQFYTRQAKYEEARQELLRATEIDPDNAVAWADLGAVTQHTGQAEEARSCYEKALRLDPVNWVAHYNLGLLQERSGDRNAAFRELGLALVSLGAASPERKAVIEDLLGNPSLSELRKDGRFTTLLSSPAILSRQAG